VTLARRASTKVAVGRVRGMIERLVVDGAAKGEGSLYRSPARRWWRSSRSASWPVLALVAKQVSRCPPVSVLADDTRIPSGQPARRPRPAPSPLAGRRAGLADRPRRVRRQRATSREITGPRPWPAQFRLSAQHRDIGQTVPAQPQRHYQVRGEGLPRFPQPTARTAGRRPASPPAASSTPREHRYPPDGGSPDPRCRRARSPRSPSMTSPVSTHWLMMRPLATGAPRSARRRRMSRHSDLGQAAERARPHPKTPRSPPVRLAVGLDHARPSVGVPPLSPG
jgi:hypothetical protein